MSIHVLHLITELSSGGAQSGLLRLLERMDSTRFRLTVVCLYNGDKLVAQQIRALGIDVIDLGMTRKWRLDALLRFFNLLRQKRPQILHTWMFHANIPGRILGRLAGVPIIISSEQTMGQEGQIRRRLNRLTAMWADCVICVAQKVADFVHEQVGIPRDKLLVIANGVDTQTFIPSATPKAADWQPRIIGNVGRLEPVKGTRFLVDAFAQFASQFPDARVWLVGDGTERQNLATQAQTQGVARQIDFLGMRPDVAALLAQMDIFVLPSHWEGMPNAVLEAMAAGLPVVATGVGGTTEVVVQDETGFLVPAADPDAMAKAIVTLLRDPTLCRRMGEAGRRRVEQHFSIQQTVAKTVGLYENLLNEKQVTAL